MSRRAKEPPPFLPVSNVDQLEPELRVWLMVYRQAERDALGHFTQDIAPTNLTTAERMARLPVARRRAIAQLMREARLFIEDVHEDLGYPGQVDAWQLVSAVVYAIAFGRNRVDVARRPGPIVARAQPLREALRIARDREHAGDEAVQRAGDRREPGPADLAIHPDSAERTRPSVHRRHPKRGGDSVGRVLRGGDPARAGAIPASVGRHREYEQAAVGRGTAGVVVHAGQSSPTGYA